jgi:chemotaxis protein methyltransferase CheR
MEVNKEPGYEKFKQRFHQKSGLNLNDYKPAQMIRRINNLMIRIGAKDYDQFMDMMNTDTKLFKEFLDYLTINVTEFFRTPEKFVELKEKVLPELMQRSGGNLHIWSAGCSTGAEPYTMAMLLHELTPNTKHRILATDLDMEMLAKAKAGVYGPIEMKNVTPSVMQKYFTINGSQYSINNDLKSRVDFKQHNLLLDNYESGFDLILCRNVVIYFTEEAKDQLYHRFFKALKPGGVLFVGGTECILNFREMGYEQYLPFFYRKPK